MVIFIITRAVIHNLKMIHGHMNSETRISNMALIRGTAEQIEVTVIAEIGYRT
jgi:hypothetical protein